MERNIGSRHKIIWKKWKCKVLFVLEFGARGQGDLTWWYRYSWVHTAPVNIRVCLLLAPDCYFRTGCAGSPSPPWGPPSRHSATCAATRHSRHGLLSLDPWARTVPSELRFRNYVECIVMPNAFIVSHFKRISDRLWIRCALCSWFITILGNPGAPKKNNKQPQP